MLKGLPDDCCQCPHWGYVLKGRLTMRFADHEEMCEAGDAFYAPPGHVPLHEADSELLLFSPTDELNVMEDAMRKNMREMQEMQSCMRTERRAQRTLHACRAGTGALIGDGRSRLRAAALVPSLDELLVATGTHSGVGRLTAGDGGLPREYHCGTSA